MTNTPYALLLIARLEEMANQTPMATNAKALINVYELDNIAKYLRAALSQPVEPVTFELLPCEGEDGRTGHRVWMKRGGASRVMFATYHKPSAEHELENLQRMFGEAAPPSAPQASGQQEVAEAAEMYQWLQERFVGYDFEWGEPSMTVAVFEVDEGFRGTRDITASIRAAIQKGAATTGKAQSEASNHAVSSNEPSGSIDMQAPLERPDHLAEG